MTKILPGKVILKERSEMKSIKGFLIDLDGVLYVGDNAIPGARETIEFLSERKYLFRFVSNTTVSLGKRFLIGYRLWGLISPRSIYSLLPLQQRLFVKNNPEKSLLPPHNR